MNAPESVLVMCTRMFGVAERDVVVWVVGKTGVHAMRIMRTSETPVSLIASLIGRSV